MKAKLFASLEAAIDKWLDDNSSTDNWPSVVVGNKTAEYMAHAAAAVLDACEESQEYGINEDMFER